MNKIIWVPMNQKCMLRLEKNNSTITETVKFDWGMYRKISKGKYPQLN